MNVEFTKSKFEKYLLGKYNNFKQAQSAPTIFAQVCIHWKKLDDGYHSKQWYRHQDNSPYREKYHKLKVVSDTEVIVENYHLDWTRHEECDMIFTFDGNAWHGKLIGDKCIVRGNARVISEIHLTKTGLQSRDRGMHIETGEKVFGGYDLYNFERKGE